MTDRRSVLRAIALGAGVSLSPALLAEAAAASPVRAQLSLNENPFGPPDSAVRAIRAHLTGLARYTGDEAQSFVNAAAKREGVDPHQIVPGDILEQLGLQLSLDGGPGGEFVLSLPGYPALADAAARVGGVAVGVPLNSRLENDLPALLSRLSARTRALFLVNPHNPSGTVSAREEFFGFVRQAAQRTLVIIDEAYLEFDQDFEARTAVSLVREGANVAVFRTFSKFFGMAALPIDYAVAPLALAERLRSQGLGNPRSLNRLAVIAATAALGDRAYASRTLAAVSAERDKWNALFEELGLKHTDSRGNFVFFDAGRPHAAVASALLAEGVQIGRSFPPLDNWTRISIGLPAENALARGAVRRL